MTIEIKDMKLGEFIRQENLSASIEETDSNPNMVSDDNWNQTASHWRVIIRKGTKKMTVLFSQGSAIVESPTLEDVLDCVASDSSSIENARSFEDWAGDFGYGEDSIKALKTYNVCKKQAERLKNLLGETAYDALLFHTERQ